MRRDPLPGRGQRLLHILIVLAGWLMFAWAWVVVAQDLPDYGALALLIVATLVISPAVTLYWVLHNLALFKLKGARTHTAQAVDAYTHDWNGRPVVADWDALRDARITVIGVVDAQKLYRNLTTRSIDPGLSRLFGKG